MPPRERQRPGRSMLTPTPEALGPTPAAAPAPAGEPVEQGEQVEPRVFLSGRVSKSLRRRAQLQAVREDRPVQDLLADAVAAYLDAHEPT